MPGRSIAGQITQIQREVTPGTPLVNAMLKVEALKMRPAYEGAHTPFKGLAGKVATSVDLADIRGQWSVEAVQDFNAIGLIAASRIDGTPTTTTPGGGTISRQHLFSMNPDGEDPKVTYTAQFGDTTQALQADYGVFQALGLEVVRGALTLTSNFMSRKPTTGATLATAGVTTMAAKPIPSGRYDVWADDTWAGLGTTKLLACYRMENILGDKFVPDAPINSAVVSYESAMEAEDQDYTFNGIFGFDAQALGLIAAFESGATKYFRLRIATSEFIEGAIPWSLQLDFAAKILSVGEWGAAPNSPAVTVPMTLTLARDPVTGKTCDLTIVNTTLLYA